MVTRFMGGVLRFMGVYEIYGRVYEIYGSLRDLWELRDLWGVPQPGFFCLKLLVLTKKKRVDVYHGPLCHSFFISLNIGKYPWPRMSVLKLILGPLKTRH